MIRPSTLLVACGLALPLCAADFRTGQAARVVIGQPSFSANDAGITATALSILNGRLYVADTSNRLLAFDLSQIPSATADFAQQTAAGCVLCGFSPVSVTYQPVIPGIATASISGKSVAIADLTNHRVLLWLDATSETALQRPDVVLGGLTVADPISVALDGQRLYVGDGALHRVLVWNSLPITDDQPADAILGQSMADVPAADTIMRPVALESDGTNLYVADSVLRRILVFSPSDVALSGSAVVNSASLLSGAVAPGTLITVSEAGMTQSTLAANDEDTKPLSKTLGGVEVVLDGVALPLQSVSPSEIRAQIPYDSTNRSSASLYIRSQGPDGGVTVTSPVAVNLDPVAPGLFAFSGGEPRPGMTVHAKEGAPVTANSPASSGETITLWGTGLGLVSTTEQAGVPNPEPDTPVQAPVTAILDGSPVQVLSAMLPEGAIGIYEIRLVLPASVAANHNATLAISQDGRLSNTVTIPVTSTP